MSTEDFLELRLFNANFFLLYYIELGRPILDFAHKNNLHSIDIITEVSKKIDKNKYPLLSKYIDQFIKSADDEWYDSVEEADNYFLQANVFDRIMKDGFSKLNYEYAAQLLTNFDLRNEFLELIGQAIKEKLPNQDFIVNDLVKFCVRRVFSVNVRDNPINNKQDDMQLSFELANHLTNYIKDYHYINLDDKADKTVRKGEVRDSFAPITVPNNKQQNKDSIKNLSKNSKIKIKFDIDDGKGDWLNYQIERNGGSKDIMLAIQVLLQKNQKSFMRSWKML